MQTFRLPATVLAVAMLVTAACSSSSPSGEATPTFEPPPASPTPASAPVPTATASQSEEIGLDNIKNLEVIASGQMTEPFSSLTWRSDGQAVFAISRQSVFVLQATADGLKQVLHVVEPAFVLDVSADGLAAVADDVHTISLRQTGSDSVTRTLTISGTLTAAHFSPDGKVLAVTTADQIVAQLWDIQTGVKAQDLTGFQTAAPVYGVSFGPAGRTLIWHSRAKAQVMDLLTGQLGPAVSETDFIGALAMSPAEQVLATTAGNVLSLWDLENADMIDTYDLPDVGASLAYSPDGKLLLIATNAGTTVLELPLLLPLGTLPGATQTVAFSPDGDGLATVNPDGLVAIHRPQ